MIINRLTILFNFFTFVSMHPFMHTQNFLLNFTMMNVAVVNLCSKKNEWYDLIQEIDDC